MKWYVFFCYLIKKKGKYVKVRDYFHNLFSEEGDHPLPVDLHIRDYDYEDVEFVYEIELEDDEEVYGENAGCSGDCSACSGCSFEDDEEEIEE